MSSNTDVSNTIFNEIHESNLSYLMLAQQMINNDKIGAMFNLGISKEVADLIESLTNAQLIKLSNANMMLTRFRFDDSAVLGMLTNYDKTAFQSVAHAAILVAGQPEELMG